MLNILNKDVNITTPDYQESYNLSIMGELTKRGVHYECLSNKDKHSVLLKYASIMKPDVIRKGFLAPHYVEHPDILVINRAPTTKDLKYSNLSDIKSPSNQVIYKLVRELGFSSPYITSLTFHATKSFNDWTLDKLKKEVLLKDLELDTINIPQIIILLGNDALNTFFNTGSTVQAIFGDIYLAEYKGAKRLFVPLPHTAYLLRDKDLYKQAIHFCIALRSVLKRL